MTWACQETKGHHQTLELDKAAKLCALPLTLPAWFPPLRLACILERPSERRTRMTWACQETKGHHTIKPWS